MLDEVLAELALAGATAVVGAMATDSWESVRSAIVRLFRRGDDSKRAGLVAQLDSNSDLVARAANPGHARQDLVPSWRLQLEALLGEHPDAADELRAFVGQTMASMPPAAQSWVQTNVARDGGHVFAAMGGNVIIHQAPSTAAQDAEDTPGDG